MERPNKIDRNKRRELTHWEIIGITAYLDSLGALVSSEVHYNDKALHWETESQQSLSAWMLEGTHTDLYITWHEDQTEDDIVMRIRTWDDTAWVIKPDATMTKQQIDLAEI